MTTDIEEVLRKALEVIEASKKKTTSTKKVSKKKTTTKKPNKKKVKEEPKLPYSEVPAILQEMKTDECISRFGILWNSEKPYTMSGNSIIKFYDDYNIDKRFKKWHMSYSNKDLIINKQLEGKPKKVFNLSVNSRIKQLEEKLGNKPKNKTSNQSDKMKDWLTKQIDTLEGMLQ